MNNEVRAAVSSELLRCACAAVDHHHKAPLLSFSWWCAAEVPAVLQPPPPAARRTASGSCRGVPRCHSTPRAAACHPLPQHPAVQSRSSLHTHQLVCGLPGCAAVPYQPGHVVLPCIWSDPEAACARAVLSSSIHQASLQHGVRLVLRVRELLRVQAPAPAPAPKLAFEGSSEAASQFGQKAIEKRAPPAAQQLPEHLPFEGGPPQSASSLRLSSQPGLIDLLPASLRS